MDDTFKAVLSFIGLTMICIFILLPVFFGVSKIKQIKQTRNQVGNITQTLSSQVSEDGYYIEGSKSYTDVWGNSIDIEYIGEPGRKVALTVTSYGPDGNLGTADDIVEMDRLLRKALGNTVKPSVKGFVEGMKD